VTQEFMIVVEVVPPAGSDAEPVLAQLEGLADLAVDSFSVATNPVAKPRMNALAMCALIQARTGRPAALHCTTRDHNRLSLQGLLWGALGLGLESVLVTTGDFVALEERETTTTVRDVNTFDLIRMAREAGLRTGVVFDPFGPPGGFPAATRRLNRKVEAGAQYAITQPIYDAAGVEAVADATAEVDIPIFLGILPLRTARHANFLHERVAGVVVPEAVRERMEAAADTVAEGIANAREVLAQARDRFAGTCLMPPFDHYEILGEILADEVRA
jgi:homocysteine S-methyltransferase